MNKIWDELSQESKDKLILKYRTCSNSEAKILEDLFEKDNLNPIKIRTWDDVLRFKLGKGFDDMLQNYSNDLTCNIGDSKLVDKLIATIKITKIIEYGFDGLFTKQDLDEQCAFTIRLKRNIGNYIYGNDFNFEICTDHKSCDLLSFRSGELAQEFIKNNNVLLKQYFML